VVDPQKCVICLTCYRCCPHGAIYYEDNRAVVSPLACQACGICASECPQNAIQMGEFTDAAMEEALRAAGSAEAPTGAPRIVAFCCQNSAAEAAQMAEAFGHELPAGLRVIRMPCAGKIDLDYILNAFVEGADGVLVMTCHMGNCKSETGNIYAGWRVEDAQRIMAEAGFAEERLRRVTLASNMGFEFARAAREMEQTLKQLSEGPAQKSA
jgi:coenzyme F420-reducing hydrogenase delta subunit/NAD-dependent dihydropyrimidine dehydrogenase PreA subunit